MIYFDEKFKLAEEQITYIHRDEKVTKPIGSEGKDWWIEFEKQWEDMKIIEIKPFIPSEEQLKRFEEIKDFPEDNLAEAMYYMKNGEFPAPPHEPKPKPSVEEMQVATMEAIGEIYALLVMGGLDG